MRDVQIKKQVIIDCDPGIDDSLALIYALNHPALDVVAITVVAGNVPVDLGVDNVFKILERVDRLDIPVYSGADQPLIREYISAQETHGMDGLGEAGLRRWTNQKAEVQSAIDFLGHYFDQPSETSLIVLGPLTNLAACLSTYPKIGSNLKRLVSMGGAYKSHGNCSPVAEYNYWCDPQAAHQVFQEVDVSVEMVGLDVTRQIVLTPNLVAYITNNHPTLGGLIDQITQFYMDFHWRQEGILGCVINDPLAVAYFIDPAICPFGFSAYTDIVEDSSLALGQTIVDDHDFYQKSKNSWILTQVDPSLFFTDFLSVLLKKERNLVRHDLDRLNLL